MKTLIAATSITLATASTLLAGFKVVPPIVTGGAEQDTSLFAGLNWTFGAGSQGVAARVGAIYTDTDGDSVTGARTFVEYGFSDGGVRFALTGLSGSTDVVGELGFGYDFTGAEAFGLLGAMGDYTELGATYGFNSESFEGYVGVNSFEFDDAPTGSECPSGSFLFVESCLQYF